MKYTTAVSDIVFGLSADVFVDNFARHIVAYGLRNSGMQLNDIGCLLNVSPERARQMVTFADRKMDQLVYTMQIKKDLLKNGIDKDLVMVDDWLFSVRTTTCLKNAGLTKMSDIDQMTDEDFLKIRNFGQKSLREVREAMDKINEFEIHRGETK